MQNRRVPTALFGATIVLSAFLLFQVQPLIAKLILPWFGGSAAVWTTCMLFFQMALLGGYGYAHWLNQQDGRKQTYIHVGLLAVAFLSLPILPSLHWKPTEPGDPLLRILGLLTVTVGLPYFLLSSTSPLLQTWYSRANGGVMPYRLFALSNLGSMAGLLTYPLLVEPNLTNHDQAWTWSIAFVVFALVCATVAFLSRDTTIQKTVYEKIAAEAPSFGEKMLWMGLAAAASALLLAVTNHVTQNIAPIPFLWVVPLSLYLLSFILCFDSDRWYVRWLFTGLAALALPGMAFAIVNRTDFTNLRVAITFYCVCIFILFMVCHGELARRRPSPGYLTSFFLMISVGGAVGGLLVGFAAPYLLNAVYDLQIIVTLTAGLFVFLLFKERADMPVQMKVGVGIAIFVTLLCLVPVGILGIKHDYSAPLLYGFAAIVAANLVAGQKMTIGSARFAIAAGLTVAMATYMAKDVMYILGGSRVIMRNFYGSLQVFDEDTDGNQGRVRVLRHGTIDHGEQFLRPENSHRPTTYFTAGSGIGQAIHILQKAGPMKVGIIGLGAGSIAAYCRPGDNYRYYDINDQVIKVAEEQFTYLSACPTHDVLLGDARLVIEGLQKENYDLLVVDAFSGDAIPVHLLTREAWKLYWRHLKPDGVLAVHVSNRYLRLGPVVDLGAQDNGKVARIVSYEGGDIDEEAASDWVLVSSRPGFIGSLDRNAAKIEPIPGLRPWTDDYSNVFKILR